MYCKLYHSFGDLSLSDPKRDGAELGSDSERSPNYDIFYGIPDNNMVYLF